MPLVHNKWCRRILLTLGATDMALPAKCIAIRCGCVWEDQYASVRHALRRMLKQGLLQQAKTREYRLRRDTQGD